MSALKSVIGVKTVEPVFYEQSVIATPGKGSSDVEYSVTCSSVTGRTVMFALIAVAGVLLLAAVAFTICSMFVASSLLANQRYYLSNADGTVLGLLQADDSSMFVKYDIMYESSLGTVTAVGIYGAITGSGPPSATADIAIPLCGLPSLVACNTTALAGTVYSIEPDQTALGPVVGTMRTNPTRYYLLISATGGDVRIPLGVSAGNT
jgi:hypothetical protein